MTRWFSTSLLALALTTATPARSADAANRPDAWPRTAAAEMARGWVQAFAAGEPAMRAFLERNLTAASLAERSLSGRTERYRELREKFGTLQLVAVTQSRPYEVHARLSDADARPHEFIFKLQSAPPHRLESVGMLETRQGGHSFGGFHH